MSVLRAAQWVDGYTVRTLLATRCVLVHPSSGPLLAARRAPGGRPNRPRDGLSALPDIPEACLEALRRSVRSAVRASAKPVSPSQGRGGSSGVTSTSAGGAARRSSAVPLESFSGLPGFGTRVPRFPGRPRETGLGAAIRSDRLSRPVTGMGLKSFRFDGRSRMFSLRRAQPFPGEDAKVTPHS